MADVNNGARAEFNVTEAGAGVLLVMISGELDIVTVEHLEPALDGLVARQADRIELDLSDLEFMDSSGLALLLRITNRFGPLRVVGAKTLVRRVIEVTGLTEVLRMEVEGQ
jgi:anti-sigma B factor antagonist